MPPLPRATRELTLDFDRLWAAYPTESSPCETDGDPNFENQCAIRMGLALQDGGFPLDAFTGARCWHGHGRRHTLRAEELAAWLRSRPGEFGRATVHRRVDANRFIGRRGIIFCRNFWGPGNQGDHIDLWKRSIMRTGDSSYIARSQEVWFWDAELASLRLAEWEQALTIAGLEVPPLEELVALVKAKVRDLTGRDVSPGRGVSTLFPDIRALSELLAEVQDAIDGAGLRLTGQPDEAKELRLEGSYRDLAIWIRDVLEEDEAA